MKVALVAPPTSNPFTGGHLYNERVANLLGMEIVRVETGNIDAWLRERAQPCILDSLYLLHADPKLVATSPPVMMLVHYLPDRAPSAPANTRERVASVLAASHGALTTSDYTARHVCASVAATRVRVCHPGVDPFPPRASPTNAIPRLLTVAHFEARKGHADLAACLSRLRDVDWAWDIVGDTRVEPATFAAFERAVDDFGLRDRLTLHGRQAPTATRDRMLRADIFALLTRYEPYGMVFAESIAAGTPVVAWDTGGIQESVTTGKTGLLAPLGDSDAAVENLEKLLHSPELRRDMSESCRSSPSVTWTETARRFAVCVTELLRGA